MRLGRCDPWIERRFRLAERQGVLTGPMSPVQAFASEYLLVLEEAEDNESLIRDLKVARFAQEPSLAQSLFPDLFSNEGVEEAEAEDEDISTTTKGIKFEADMARDEVLETLRRYQTTTVTAAEIPLEDEWA